MVPLQSKFPINAFITPRELLRRGDLIWLFWRSYLRLDGHTQPRNLIGTKRVISWPRNLIGPSVGRRWPVSVLNKVVSPAPLGLRTG